MYELCDTLRNKRDEIPSFTISEDENFRSVQIMDSHGSMIFAESTR